MPDVANDVLRQWKDVRKEGNWDALLLGNGASIAVNPIFDYKSLHRVAARNGWLGDRVVNLFKLLNNTKDFEAVLLALWHADLVNGALGAPNEKVLAAYHEVRTALLRAVEHVHPRATVFSDYLMKIGELCSQFKTVVTFNYDLILYWAIVTATKDDTLTYEFKDCFIGENHLRFAGDWTRMRNPLRSRSVTLVFYGHGHLALVRDARGVSDGAQGAKSTSCAPVRNDMLT